MTDPIDVELRELIEAATPCPVYGGRHTWYREQVTGVVYWTSGRTETVTGPPYWRCHVCGIVHTTNPVARP